MAWCMANDIVRLIEAGTLGRCPSSSSSDSQQYRRCTPEEQKLADVQLRELRRDGINFGDTMVEIIVTYFDSVFSGGGGGPSADVALAATLLLEGLITTGSGAAASVGVLSASWLEGSHFSDKPLVLRTCFNILHPVTSILPQGNDPSLSSAAIGSMLDETSLQQRIVRRNCLLHSGAVSREDRRAMNRIAGIIRTCFSCMIVVEFPTPEWIRYLSDAFRSFINLSSQLLSSSSSPSIELGEVAEVVREELQEYAAALTSIASLAGRNDLLWDFFASEVFFSCPVCGGPQQQEQKSDCAGSVGCPTCLSRRRSSSTSHQDQQSESVSSPLCLPSLVEVFSREQTIWISGTATMTGSNGGHVKNEPTSPLLSLLDIVRNLLLLRPARSPVSSSRSFPANSKLFSPYGVQHEVRSIFLSLPLPFLGDRIIIDEISVGNREGEHQQGQRQQAYSVWLSSTAELSLSILRSLSSLGPSTPPRPILAMNNGKNNTIVMIDSDEDGDATTGRNQPTTAEELAERSRHSETLLVLLRACLRWLGDYSSLYAAASGGGNSIPATTTMVGGGVAVVAGIKQLCLALLETAQYLFNASDTLFTAICGEGSSGEGGEGGSSNSSRDVFELMLWYMVEDEQDDAIIDDDFDELDQLLLRECLDDDSVIAGCASGSCRQVSASIIQLWIEYDHLVVTELVSSWYQFSTTVSVTETTYWSALVGSMEAICKQCDVSGFSLVDSIQGAEDSVLGPLAQLLTTTGDALTMMGGNRQQQQPQTGSGQLILLRARLIKTLSDALRLSQNVHLCRTGLHLLVKDMLTTGQDDADGCFFFSRAMGIVSSAKIITASPIVCDTLTTDGSIPTPQLYELILSVSRRRHQGYSSSATNRVPSPLGSYCSCQALSTMCEITPDIIHQLIFSSSPDSDVTNRLIDALTCAVATAVTAPLAQQLSKCVSGLWTTHLNGPAVRAAGGGCGGTFFVVEGSSSSSLSPCCSTMATLLEVVYRGARGGGGGGIQHQSSSLALRCIVDIFLELTHGVAVPDVDVHSSHEQQVHCECLERCGPVILSHIEDTIRTATGGTKFASLTSSSSAAGGPSSNVAAAAVLADCSLLDDAMVRVLSSAVSSAAANFSLRYEARRKNKSQQQYMSSASTAALSVAEAAARCCHQLAAHCLKQASSSSGGVGGGNPTSSSMLSQAVLRYSSTTSSNACQALGCSYILQLLSSASLRTGGDAPEASARAVASVWFGRNMTSGGFLSQAQRERNCPSSSSFTDEDLQMGSLLLTYMCEVVTYVDQHRTDLNITGCFLFPAAVILFHPSAFEVLLVRILRGSVGSGGDGSVVGEHAVKGGLFPFFSLWTSLLCHCDKRTQQYSLAAWSRLLLRLLFAHSGGDTSASGGHERERNSAVAEFLSAFSVGVEDGALDVVDVNEFPTMLTRAGCVFIATKTLHLRRGGLPPTAGWTQQAGPASLSNSSNTMRRRKNAPLRRTAPQSVSIAEMMYLSLLSVSNPKECGYGTISKLASFTSNSKVFDETLPLFRVWGAIHQQQQQQQQLGQYEENVLAIVNCIARTGNGVEAAEVILSGQYFGGTLFHHQQQGEEPADDGGCHPASPMNTVHLKDIVRDLFGGFGGGGGGR